MTEMTPYERQRQARRISAKLAYWKKNMSDGSRTRFRRELGIEVVEQPRFKYYIRANDAAHAAFRASLTPTPTAERDKSWYNGFTFISQYDVEDVA